MAYTILVTIDWPTVAQATALRFVEDALIDHNERLIEAQRRGHMGADADTRPEGIHVSTPDGTIAVSLDTVDDKRCADFEAQPSGTRTALRRCTQTHGHGGAHQYGAWYLPGRGA